MFSRKLIAPIAAGAAAIAIGAGAYGIVSATASNGSGAVTTAASPAAASGRPAFGGGGSNARSGPAAGGAVGIVESVSASGFTLSTPAGQKVTVNTTSISASAIPKGESVLVLGTVNGTAIKATKVIAQGSGNGSATSSAVVPFQRGATSTSKEVGEIPASYTQGSGTIVGGTAANKATEAALAAYPGGIVDRVVKVSKGEYEVHNIGVNWPHHIFVNKSFKVVGAN
jgi:hypothetical protein